VGVAASMPLCVCVNRYELMNSARVRRVCGSEYLVKTGYIRKAVVPERLTSGATLKVWPGLSSGVQAACAVLFSRPPVVSRCGCSLFAQTRLA
jgi:hypothetical protein